MRDRTSTLNMDCLDYMKSLPDNAFDLIIADPPYGDCDGSWGVGQGSRTTQDAMPDTLGRGRFGGLFSRYRQPSGSGQGAFFRRAQPYLVFGTTAAVQAICTDGLDWR